MFANRALHSSAPFSSASLFAVTTSPMSHKIPPTVEHPPAPSKRPHSSEICEDTYLASAFNKRLRLDPSASILLHQWGVGDAPPATSGPSATGPPCDASQPSFSPSWGGGIWRVNSGESRGSDIEMTDRQDSDKASDSAGNSDLSGMELTATGKQVLASRDLYPRRLLEKGLSQDYGQSPQALHLTPAMCQIVQYSPPLLRHVPSHAPASSVTIEDITDLERTNSEDRGRNPELRDYIMPDIRCQPKVEEPREMTID